MLNRIFEKGKTTVKPEVGMGVTMLMFSDRHAGTIVSVSKSGKTFKFQRDTAIRNDENGMSDCQDYRYEPNPKNPVLTAYLTRDGRWKIRKDGTTLQLGVRQEYYDYSF